MIGSIEGLRMMPQLKLKIEELAVLCRAHGVRSLEVFGSATREDFDPLRSDIDLIVEFETPDLGPWMRRFFEFGRAVEQLLGAPVDLHLASAVPGSRLDRAIEESRVPVYAAA